MIVVQATELARAPFSEGTTTGEIVNRDGYHQPGSRRIGLSCGCRKTTDKGAYRDVTVEMPDGRTVHYYHQSPIVVIKNGRAKLDNHGYKTSTTKERINRYIPFRVFQENFGWYIELPEGTKPFENGMIVEL